MQASSATAGWMARERDTRTNLRAEQWQGEPDTQPTLALQLAAPPLCRAHFSRRREPYCLQDSLGLLASIPSPNFRAETKSVAPLD